MACKKSEIILWLMCIIIAIPIFGLLYTHPLQSGMSEVDIKLIYQGDFPEKAELASNRTFEDMALSIRLYKMNISQEYFVRMKNGNFFDLKGREEYIYYFQASKGNWCYLEKNDQCILWIFVEK